MKLGLSSAAAPEADLDALIAACSRRGLVALELRDGDAHGIGPEQDLDGVRSSLDRAAAASVAIAAWRIGASADSAHLAAFGEALGSPLLIDSMGDIRERVTRARQLREGGAQVCVVVGGPAAEHEANLVSAAALPIAWDADPALPSFRRHTDILLRRHAERLRHICLIGGGPEVALHEGNGVAELMGRLALEGFGGTLCLAPSSSRYRIAWQGWLGRTRWGCGSAGARDSSLASLEIAAPTAPAGVQPS